MRRGFALVPIVVLAASTGLATTALSPRSAVTARRYVKIELVGQSHSLRKSNYPALSQATRSETIDAA
jgi:hypothetical protein